MNNTPKNKAERLQALRKEAKELGLQDYMRLNTESLAAVIKNHKETMANIPDTITIDLDTQPSGIFIPQAIANKPLPVDMYTIDPNALPEGKYSVDDFKDISKEGNKAHQTAKKIKEAQLLIRARITCNNPNKRDWGGETFSVANELAVFPSKYIPFGQAYMIPKIILNAIKERKYQYHYYVKINDIDVKKTKLLPEFNVELLPNMTLKQYKTIEQRQRATRMAEENEEYDEEDEEEVI